MHLDLRRCRPDSENGTMATIDEHSGDARAANGGPRHAKLFQALVENSTDTIFLIDLDTEECIYVSPAVRSLLGRDPATIIGLPLTQFVHPEDAAEVLARSARRRQGRGVRTAVTRMSHHDGNWVWVQATASPVLEHEGRSTAVFTVSAAAERVRAEIGLRSARLRLRGLLEQMDNGRPYLQTRDGSYDLTVEALAAALELRDDETSQHTRRVTDVALALTRVVDPALAREPDVRYGFAVADEVKLRRHRSVTRSFGACRGVSALGRDRRRPTVPA